MPSNTWILTHTGGRVELEHPHWDDIFLTDIAHHLARIGRYTGAGDMYISVAQHSVHVSCICPPSLAREGLLHDAAEAYLTDVSTPLKRLLRGVDDLPEGWRTVLEGALDAQTLAALREALPGYRELERRFQAVIAERFDIALTPPGLKIYDVRSALAERRDNGPYGCPDEDWLGMPAGTAPSPHPEVVYPWLPEQAEAEFLARAEELGIS